VTRISELGTTPAATSNRRTHAALMLCKIWGFHGGDYEEWRPLGYKIPVRNSLETHYVSATESSQLLLCKIWGFHGGDYEECHLLGCYAGFLQVLTSVGIWMRSAQNNICKLRKHKSASTASQQHVKDLGNIMPSLWLEARHWQWDWGYKNQVLFT
jgi:hypothetical protein